MFKKQNGITLVALVITIIVLLILAGVTISMVVGDNGILTRSKQSNFETISAEAYEKVQMATADLQAEIEVQLARNSAYVLTNEDITKVFVTNGGCGDGWTMPTISDNDADTTGTQVADGDYKIKFVTEELKSAAKDQNKAEQEYTLKVSGNNVSIEKTTSDSTSGGY